MENVQRSGLAQVKATLSALGAVVAEVDRHLRYVSIHNPHPDFPPEAVLGKRDDELTTTEEAAPLMELKRRALEERRPLSHILTFHRSDGLRSYSLFAYPVVDADGEVHTVLTVAFDLPSIGGASA